MATHTNSKQIERWDIFELSMDGPSDGNPFLDVTPLPGTYSGEVVVELPGRPYLALQVRAQDS